MLSNDKYYSKPTPKKRRILSWTLGVFLLIVSGEFILSLMFRTESVDDYKWSYLPIFHPLNTVQSAWGSQSGSESDARFIMRRKVYVGDVDATIKKARKDCRESISEVAAEEYSCHVLSCDPSVGPQTTSRFYDSLRKHRCNGADKNEYLYVLSYHNSSYFCAR